MKNQHELINRYKEDPSVLGEIMLEYQSIVEANAKAVANQLPKHIELDDLISEGMFGLADAVKKFDDSLGYKFSTYASFRIRGAIFDFLRKEDWAPRSLRSKNKEVEKAKQKLSSELNREPSNEEVATLLGWEVEEVYQSIGSSSAANMSNLDDLVSIGGTKFSLSEVIPDENVDADDFFLIKEKLIQSFARLSEEAITIMNLYYVQNLSLKDIGEVIGVTESRTCQIHTTALAKIWEECAL
jgi:RNA polymerase sigma factor for flagellar operon FliA